MGNLNGRNKNMKKVIQNLAKKLLLKFIPEFHKVLNDKNNFNLLRDTCSNSCISSKSRLYSPFTISNLELGDYSYIGKKSLINLTKIGKFCSIGPNFVCGYGIHPTNGISTAPMFYANNTSNGFSLCNESKIVEQKKITIGNDVWIGINVTVLDGVSIGDGAIIAAGAVVVSDVPDYAIFGGVPAKLIRYRFTDDQILAFKKIKWWDFDFEKLKEVESNFFDVDKFISENP